MHLALLTIANFRCIPEATIEPDPSGVTVITGRNGTGKSSVLEAIAYLATLQSFRGSSKEAMVRSRADHAILRAEVVVGSRPITIEAELAATGQSRTMVNRQAVRRRSDLVDSLRTTVFSPEDIEVIRSGPAHRRRFLDELLAVVDAKVSVYIDDLDKVLRQRSALLRQSGGRLSPDIAATLDVWDSRLEAVGAPLAQAREDLVARLAPLVERNYSRLAGEPVPIGLQYRRSWEGTLIDALAACRSSDLARGVTLVGPHRDELDLTVSGLPGRSHASQGEQRSLALALRLAAHQLATDRIGSAPVLLLDDVFSELDPFRSSALVAGLPPGQTVLTTAVPPPGDVTTAKTYLVEAGGRLSVSSRHPDGVR